MMRTTFLCLAAAGALAAQPAACACGANPPGPPRPRVYRPSLSDRRPEMVVRDPAGHISRVAADSAPAHHYILGLDTRALAAQTDAPCACGANPPGPPRPRLYRPSLSDRRPEMVIRDPAGHISRVAADSAPAHHYILGLDLQGDNVWVATAHGLSRGVRVK